MRALRLAGRMALGDGLSVLRDPLLRWILALVPLFALLVRWILLLSGYATMVGSLIPGFIVGMMLLDERDDGTLAAVLVTPLPFSRYLALKLAVPTLAGTVLTVACLPLTGLDQWRWGYVAATCAAALWAPVAALSFAGLAANKVQGILVFRLINVVVFIPLAAYGLSPPWEYAFGILPGYWALEAFWATARGDGILFPLAVAVAYQSLVIHLLARRFHRVARRS